MALRSSARLASLLAWVLAAWAVAADLKAESARLQPGSGRFEFTGWSGPALPVWYYCPKAARADMPVLFVMHGVGRNGDEYRDQWVGLAEQHHVVLLVPTFSKESFPGRDAYNFGNVFAPDGARRPEDLWAYTAIERIFDAVVAANALQARTYSIYGHSAGAQLVHRLAFFLPSARVTSILSANAGAYMLPDFAHRFPYGLGASGVTEDQLKQALQKPVVVLLGDADVDPHHPALPKGAEPEAQGLHRFARGLNYFKAASEQAARLGVTLRWKLVIAPGVAHSNTEMAAFAAEQLFGPRGR